MREQFQRDLINSAFLHRPLPLYEEGSLEKEWEQRKVLLRKEIFGKDTKSVPVHEGEGGISCYRDEAGSKVLCLQGNTVTYCWPEAMSPDGDCAFYGTVHARLNIQDENWENFNCLTFYIKPECQGSRIVNMNLGIKNEGRIKVPDEYYREGNHVVNLINHEWNRCIWEFGSMARDKITELDFSCGLFGKDTSTGDEVRYLVKDVNLEKTEKHEPDKGWLSCLDGIAYSTSGYFARGDKTAVTGLSADEFQIIGNNTGITVYKGKVIKRIFSNEEYGILDFSPLSAEGTYYIQVGDFKTKPFDVKEEVYEEAVWKILNFLFCERCGFPVPERHGLCHRDVTAKYGDKIISFCGGWHDAGDMSQQLIHTAEVTQALLEMAEAVKLKKDRNAAHKSERNREAETEFKRNQGIDADKNNENHMNLSKLLYERLIEEALWGLEFIIASRFGDGYRATSAGIVRWTNGILGDEDDEKVRFHNHAFENLLCSGICGIAAGILKDSDEELAWKCLQIAKEDYAFGMERFKTVGMELPIMWEHTYSSSKSQYYALITWTASVLYEQTKEHLYADTAAEYGACLLNCQETQGKANGFKGFFYRDEEKKIIVHYSHQSREYMFVQAFERLCKTQPDHEEKTKWENALALYGDYLKKLMNYASPYKMLPAGIYHEGEINDKESFQILHLLVDYEEQKEHYRKQLKQGTPLEDGYYIKNFPVWFSFRGNTAIHLAMGMASAAVGGYFKDEELLQIAKEQLYWISGKNPFHQSLIYGEGGRYVQQYAVMPGEMTGEIPVGIQTNADEDIPYWPHNNNATYKEVWTSSACRWLWTLSAIYRADCL
ncbi:glycoside hydrolase family 9 protein [Anaerocolumna sp. MB42-C2]|uniref:glycoside hydrolase family 9 protein n=1 Tax=Anaerocolumna sp. MB42-C2 TaxID=3070997 RepID=UPI0027DFACA9|nr:glycoside hydrolase family 9 protein [Anaerocolumna sp. MB42-C2]WMJ85357.1 glycoside hydrolase family 9 protein [Anaerocolumna sp. MB42-C2]